MPQERDIVTTADQYKVVYGLSVGAIFIVSLIIHVWHVHVSSFYFYFLTTHFCLLRRINVFTKTSSTSLTFIRLSFFQALSQYTGQTGGGTAWLQSGLNLS